MRLVILAALMFALCPTVSVAQVPSKGQKIRAAWKFHPEFEEGKTYTNTYANFRIGKMAPISLVMTGNAVLIKKGKELMGKDIPLMATSSRVTFCEPKRIVGRSTVTCLVDTDQDGKMDSYFKRANVKDMTQSVEFGKLKPLTSPVALVHQPNPETLVYFDVIADWGRSQLDIADPSFRSRVCIYADHSGFLSGLYGKTRANCTYTYTQQLSKMPLTFGEFGYLFTITEVRNDGVTYSINKIKR